LRMPRPNFSSGPAQPDVKKAARAVSVRRCITFRIRFSIDEMSLRRNEIL